MANDKKIETGTRKMNIWEKFMNFCHGVKVETKRIHWTEKKDLFKYSVTTLVFVIFLSLFFYVVDILFALLHTVIG